MDTISVKNRVSLTDLDLSDEFKNEYSHILKYRKCYGYCIWKPHIILQELEKLKDNEILFYVDSTDLPKKPLFDFMNEYFKTNSLLLFNRGYNHGEWTKRDTFILMDCDFSNFHGSVQLEAGVIALKKTNENISLMKEWFEHCTDIRKVSDEPNTCGLNNLNNFKEHRHDQSILTNLSLLKGIISYNFNSDYIQYNYNQPLIY